MRHNPAIGVPTVATMSATSISKTHHTRRAMTANTASARTKINTIARVLACLPSYRVVRLALSLVEIAIPAHGAQRDQREPEGDPRQRVGQQNKKGKAQGGRQHAHQPVGNPVSYTHLRAH